MKKSLLVLLLLCFALVSNAQVANQPGDLLVCDDDGDGFAVFNLTINEPEILGTQDPTDFNITFHISQSDADNSINPIVNSSAFVNSVNPQTIFARLEALSNGNFDTTNFDLIVSPLPLDLGPFEMVQCDDELNGSTLYDEISTFDLTTQDVLVAGGDPSITVQWYETIADEQIDNPIVDPTMYQNVATPQTVIGRATSQFGCSNIVALTLTVLPNPSPNFTPTPLEVCDDNGDGFAAFILTDKDAEIINGEPDVLVLYYETFIDAQAGAPGTNILSPYTNVIAFNQVVYARVTNNIPPAVLACFTIVELELRVFDGCPIITLAPTNVFINEGDDNGLAIFDLTVNEPQMLGSQDPNIYRFSYHETYEDSEENVNEIQSKTAYQNIANPQTIYVRLTNNVNGSYALIDFEIETDGVLGVNENSLNNIQLYPNPVSESLIIQSQFLTSESSVIIYNLQGQKMFSEVILPVNGKIILAVSEMNSGLYLLKLTSEGNTVTRKLIKN